jgi:hypothetical protein
MRRPPLRRFGPIDNKRADVELRAALYVVD